jgi:rhodanese-related sulfurtransferase
MDISVQELKEKLDNTEDIILIDVREVHEHNQFKIGSDVLIPLGQLMDSIAGLEGHKNDEIVVYCHSDARSAIAQSLLEAVGFSNVRNLTGGILAWHEAFGK